MPPSPQSPDKSAEGTVEDWATESLLAAREAYVDPATGQRIKSGTKLGSTTTPRTSRSSKRECTGPASDWHKC